MNDKALAKIEADPEVAVAKWRENSALMETVREAVFPGANDAELALFLHDCQRQGCHPLDRMIHPTTYTDQRSGKRKYVAVTSIDLMRSRAAESGEYAGSDEPDYGPEVESRDQANKNYKHPEWCRVTVHRIVQGQRYSFTHKAWWSEYYPGDARGAMWRKMPHNQLGKCCEAAALRKGFPRELGRVFVEGERIEDEQPDFRDIAKQEEREPVAEVRGAVDAAGAAPVPEKDWRKEFAALARANGYSAKRGLTQLVNVLRSEHGLAPIQWAQVEAMEQATWKDYYERCAKRGWPRPSAEAPAGPEPDAPPANTSHAEVLPDDVPPPDDAPDYGDAAEPPDPEGEALLNAYHDLEVAANRLTGVVGVTVLKEHPAGSGKHWIVFKPVLLAGTPLKVWEAGGPTLGVRQMQNLTRALVDEAQKRDRTR